MGTTTNRANNQRNKSTPERRDRNPQSGANDDTNQPSAAEAIWQVVARIPPGNVASYKQVAALAGLPGRARQVGRVLSRLPGDTSLPWHRVVNAAGRIAVRPGAGRQRELLAAEGVTLLRGRVSAAQFWRP